MHEQIWESPDKILHSFGELNPTYGVWDWDLGCNTIYADEATARIFGVDAGLAKRGLPPEVYFQNIHKDDRQMIIDHSLRSISTIGQCADNFRIFDDMGTRWVHSQGRCFADRENKPKCFIGLVAEIGQTFETERKAHSVATSGGAGDDILYLSLYARRIANETNRPFVAYLLDMVIAEVTDLKVLSRC
jgi:hypothetical protein